MTLSFSWSASLASGASRLLHWVKVIIIRIVITTLHNWVNLNNGIEYEVIYINTMAFINFYGRFNNHHLCLPPCTFVEACKAARYSLLSLSCSEMTSLSLSSSSESVFRFFFRPFLPRDEGEPGLRLRFNSDFFTIRKPPLIPLWARKVHQRIANKLRSPGLQR